MARALCTLEVLNVARCLGKYDFYAGFPDCASDECGDGVDAGAIFRCWLERCWSVMQENGVLSRSAAADSVEELDMACSSEHLHNKCEGCEGIPHVGTTVKPTKFRLRSAVFYARSGS
ncbi:hypothetical protein MRX96_035266 [Rhipicephalus microplus]